jgi:hypothetical protein
VQVVGCRGEAQSNTNSQLKITLLLVAHLGLLSIVPSALYFFNREMVLPIIKLKYYFDFMMKKSCFQKHYRKNEAVFFSPFYFKTIPSSRFRQQFLNLL